METKYKKGGTGPAGSFTVGEFKGVRTLGSRRKRGGKITSRRKSAIGRGGGVLLNEIVDTVLK